MAISIYKSPVPLYYDSDSAFAKRKTSDWPMTGLHQTVNQIERNGVTVYAINHPTYGYTVGWVRGDELGRTGINEETELLHTVRNGETLWKIANQYNTTVANLRAWNNLKGDIILIGQRLLVRLGKTTIIEEGDDGEVTEVVPTVMTVEIDGVEYDLIDGINTNSGIKLPPGMTRLKVKGDGTVAFNFSHEVMG